MSGKLCLVSNFGRSRSGGECQVLQNLLAHDESERVWALDFIKFARWREFHCLAALHVSFFAACRDCTVLPSDNIVAEDPVVGQDGRQFEAQKIKEKNVSLGIGT